MRTFFKCWYSFSTAKSRGCGPGEYVRSGGGGCSGADDEQAVLRTAAIGGGIVGRQDQVQVSHILFPSCILTFRCKHDSSIVVGYCMSLSCFSIYSTESKKPPARRTNDSQTGISSWSPTTPKPPRIMTPPQHRRLNVPPKMLQLHRSNSGRREHNSIFLKVEINPPSRSSTCSPFAALVSSFLSSRHILRSSDGKCFVLYVGFKRFIINRYFIQ